jgi:polysaccharide deacetylase family protein (PEP-CTERM system associated)
MTEFHPPPDKRHILTVALEDYFHVGAFNQLIQQEQWYRFPTRFEQNTRKALDLLDQFHIKATFFVLGWIADKQPDIVREVVRRGHEIASRGYYHRGTRQMTREEFRQDLARSREALERAGGAQVLGYRVAHEWLMPADLWALEVLAEGGYAYDSSILPRGRTFRSEPNWRFIHRRRCGSQEIWEVPLSTWSFAGWNLPIAGGNYFRQFPYTFLKHAVRHWHMTCPAPFVMYFHVWELDTEQPKIGAASPLARIRHYRNLEKMHWVLEEYFSTYQFTGVAETLGLTPAVVEPAPPVSAAQLGIELCYVNEQLQSLSLSPHSIRDDRRDRVPVSIVVPCFNEELVLPYLANTLRSVEETLSQEYELYFIFVDDGSNDGTWDSLQQQFGARRNCFLVRHLENSGVAAAILTGIRSAETDIVCSIDCDCTYDPHELKSMLPLLSEGVDLVTASPYHPQGKVLNVPRWRLSLSKAASFLYRCVLPQQLHTYTSCFRVYRRKAITALVLREQGFLGVAELIGHLGLRNAQIVEHPAVLAVRVLGHSKMKVLRTVFGHLRLLSRLLFQRAIRSRKGREAPDTEPSALLSPTALVTVPPLLPAKERLHE